MKYLKAAFRDSLPVMAGYLVLSFGYGIIMNERGYGWLAPVCSLLVYAGSMQYASIGLMTGGASLLTVALTTFAVNIRHLFYGISMAVPYRNTGKCKPYLIFGLTDETYSIVCDGTKPTEYCFWLTLLNQSYWVLGTVLGVVFGSRLPFSTEGIDFALTALFVVAFTAQQMSIMTDGAGQKMKRHLPGIAGIVLTLAARLLFGPDHFLIPAMAMILLFLIIYLKKGERHNDAG